MWSLRRRDCVFTKKRYITVKCFQLWLEFFRVEDWLFFLDFFQGDGWVYHKPLWKVIPSTQPAEWHMLSQTRPNAVLLCLPQTLPEWSHRTEWPASQLHTLKLAQHECSHWGPGRLQRDQSVGETQWPSHHSVHRMRAIPPENLLPGFLTDSALLQFLLRRLSGTPLFFAQGQQIEDHENLMTLISL